MRLFSVLALLLLLAAPLNAAGGVMGEGMMGSEQHREMMRRMMGDMLPPPTDPADLPEPQRRVPGSCSGSAPSVITCTVRVCIPPSSGRRSSSA